MILAHALASCIPCTVSRTRSAPASAQRMICSTEPSTSRVSVVVIVCVAIGCSEPMGTLPTHTVRVGLRSGVYTLSQ